MTKVVLPSGLQIDTAGNPLDAVVNDMYNRGVKTAGQAFIGGDTTAAKHTYYPDLVQTPPAVDTRSNISKVFGGFQAVGSFIDNIAIKAAKNVGGIFETDILQPAKALTFQATHNFQDETSYYREQNTKASNEYLGTKKKLTDDFQAGRINQTDYNKQLADLDKTVGQEVVQTNQKYQTANDRQYKWKDYQSGQYHDPTAGDLFNVADGAITIASLGTAGALKAGFAETATTGATKFLGRDLIVGGLEKIGATSAAADAKVLAGSIDEIVSKFITKVPGLNEYMTRQIGKLGADITAKKFATNAVAEMLLHAPLREMNIESAQAIVNSVRDGKFLETPAGQSWLSSGVGQAVMMAGMTLEGGPLGFILKTFGDAGKKLQILTYGSEFASEISKFGEMSDEEIKTVLQKGGTNFEGTFFDHIFRMADSEGNAVNGWKYVGEHPEFVPVMKSIQESIASGKVAGAAANAAMSGIVKDLLASGQEINVESVMQHMMNWQKAGELGDQASKLMVASGKLGAGQKAVVAKFSRETISALINKVDSVATETKAAFKEAGGTSKAMLFKSQQQAAEEIISQAVNKGEFWAQHDGLVEDIVNGIRDAKNVGEIKAALRQTDAAKYLRGVPSSISSKLKDLGYIMVLPDNVKNPFVNIADAAGAKLTSILVGDVSKSGLARTLGLTKDYPVTELNAVLGEDVARVAGRSPGFAGLGRALDKMGIGFGNGGTEAYRMITTNAINNIEDIGVGLNGVSTMSKLQAFAEQSRTINDLRQMTKGEIASALTISRDSAKDVQRAIIKSYLDVPLEVRGLADSIVDFANQNPLQRLYGRVQGALRYSYNPFFRLQETVETKLLGAAATDGRTAWMSTFGALVPKDRAYLNEVVKKMESSNILEASMYGEAANNQVVGRISAHIGSAQKRDLAAVVDAMADKAGLSVDDLLATRGQDVMDIVRPIVQYPTEGAINSHMAKMFGLAAFPSRYNVKVTSLVAKALANQTPLVQGAVLRGIWDFHSWLKTDAGLSWQQDYADEIKFMEWLTPINSLEWTMKQLQGERSSWADVGQIGGLPFGVFSQILQDQGIINQQSPYVDSKTGEIFNTKIPVTAKGRLSIGIMDMLGSAFTWPGRSAGLPGKQQFIRNAAENLTGAGRGDFQTIYHDPSELSPQQQKDQTFWKERAAASGVRLPTPPKPDYPTLYNPVNGQPRVVQPKITKSQIAAMKASAAKPKKKKLPVDFKSIVNR